MYTTIVRFRVEAALTDGDPHRSVRDPFVIRFLKYDSVPDKPLHHLSNFWFGQDPNFKKLLKLIPIDESFV